MSPLGLVNLLPATTVNLNVGLGMAQLRTNAEAKSLDTVKNKILGACWTSFGQSNVWAGFFSTGLGHMYYQQEGNKALSMMHFGHLYDVTLTLAEFGKGSIGACSACIHCFQSSIW